MIRFLLVLLAFVSALLAFIFQETALFVASGGLLLVSVVLLVSQVHEGLRRKRRLKRRAEMTPEDEMKARGILEVRPKAGPAVAKGVPEPTIADKTPAVARAVPASENGPAAERAPLPSSAEHQPAASEEELRALGILGIQPKEATQQTLFEEALEAATESESVEAATEPEPAESVTEPDSAESVTEPDSAEAATEPDSAEAATRTEPSEKAAAPDFRDEQERAEDEPEDTEAGEPEPAPFRRRVEVDAHLPALQQTLGAHTACLIDVDTESFVYRLRSVVSEGAVDNAGTEYPFAGFFLSDLLAETTVVDLGGEDGLDIETMGLIRSPNGLRQLVAAPVMNDGLPAAFFVAFFESMVGEGCKEAVASAGEFFSSLYALQADEPAAADSPLASATRTPRPLRLVKSNPRSVQRKIIAEEISRARVKAHPLSLALVCLDSATELSKTDAATIQEVEAWMRDCLEAVTPDGRVEYFGELGYGILQSRDVTDVEGWVKRAQIAFARTNGPVKAHPIVGVAMLSDQHQGPDDLQSDAFKALRAAYECGDSTILVS